MTVKHWGVTAIWNRYVSRLQLAIEISPHEEYHHKKPMINLLTPNLGGFFESGGNPQTPEVTTYSEVPQGLKGNIS